MWDEDTIRLIDNRIDNICKIWKSIRKLEKEADTYRNAIALTPKAKATFDSIEASVANLRKIIDVLSGGVFVVFNDKLSFHLATKGYKCLYTKNAFPGYDYYAFVYDDTPNLRAEIEKCCKDMGLGIHRLILRIIQ